MAIRRFSNSSISTGAKSSKLWDGETFPGYFESIASVNVASDNQQYVIFNNIPQNYKHLQLRWVSRMFTGGYAPSMYFILNGDSGNNYSNHILRGNGSNVVQSAYTSSGPYAYGGGNSATSTASVFTVCMVDILDYTSTSKTKTLRWSGGFDTNTEGQVWVNSTGWYATPQAITSFTLSQDGNFVKNSQFSLYGIRG